MAKPHGFTVDTMPAAKANPSGATAPTFPNSALERPDRDSTRPLAPPDGLRALAGEDGAAVGHGQHQEADN